MVVSTRRSVLFLFLSPLRHEEELFGGKLNEHHQQKDELTHSSAVEQSTGAFTHLNKFDH